MYSYEYSYRINEQLFYDKFFIHIYYKNMDIKWVLEQFSLQETNEIAKLILKSTKHVQFNNISKFFICKNKWGWNTIEKILMRHYFKKQEENPLTDNLIQLTLQNFLSDSDEWQNTIT